MDATRHDYNNAVSNAQNGQQRTRAFRSIGLITNDVLTAPCLNRTSATIIS
jgi:hypothetical protein